MCEHCVEEITEGKRPPMTDEMWQLAGLVWDWYRMPGNDTGGVLHIVLDDYNIEDHCLDYCAEARYYDSNGECAETPPDVAAARDAIVDGLRPLTEPERVMVVHSADPYGSFRPKEPS